MTFCRDFTAFDFKNIETVEIFCCRVQGDFNFWLQGGFYFRSLTVGFQFRGDCEIRHNFFSELAMYQESFEQQCLKWVLELISSKNE